MLLRIGREQAEQVAGLTGAVVGKALILTLMRSPFRSRSSFSACWLSLACMARAGCTDAVVTAGALATAVAGAAVRSWVMPARATADAALEAGAPATAVLALAVAAVVAMAVVTAVEAAATAAVAMVVSAVPMAPAPAMAAVAAAGETTITTENEAPGLHAPPNKKRLLQGAFFASASLCINIFPGHDELQVFLE